ncbi:MAG: c-type cytochrome [Pseudomonadota bacterium]
MSHPSFPRAALACAALLLAASAAQAEPGRLLASQCAQCHGTNGAGPGFDELAGKNANDTYDELIEMKYRSNIEGIMDRQARGYTDAQLRLIADYLATLPGNGGD